MSLVTTQAEMPRGWLLDERITATFVPTPLSEAVMVPDWPDNAGKPALGRRCSTSPPVSITLKGKLFAGSSSSVERRQGNRVEGEGS
jgi:hypothetical protein